MTDRSLTAEHQDFDQEQIRAAMASIRCGFVWEKTPQGHEYWRSVEGELDRLLRMARNGVPANG